jgi:hypothetical protein
MVYNKKASDKFNAANPDYNRNYARTFYRSRYNSSQEFREKERVRKRLAYHKKKKIDSLARPNVVGDNREAALFIILDEDEAFEEKVLEKLKEDIVK